MTRLRLDEKKDQKIPGPLGEIPDDVSGAISEERRGRFEYDAGDLDLMDDSEVPEDAELLIKPGDLDGGEAEDAVPGAPAWENPDTVSKRG